MEDRELFEFMNDSDQYTAEMLLLIKQALIDKPRSQATREKIISAINEWLAFKSAIVTLKTLDSLEIH